MNRIILYPYKMGSESARALQEQLSVGGRRVLRVRPDGRYRHRLGDILINWGSSRVPAWLGNNAIANHPEAVALASNKLNTFRKLQEAGVPTIPWTTDAGVASTWDKVYVRHELQGHSGAGIEIIEQQHDAERDRLVNDLIEQGYEDFARQITDEAVQVPLPNAPLYTKAVANNGEYRVHVFNGEVIDYRKKSRHHEDEPTDEQSAVRTLGNGWIYRVNNLKRLERVEQLAIQAVSALGLDFGAVDIIKDEGGNVWVLEVNTAVGMDSHTLASYATKINEYINA
jgi:glutathione synthase/RimK-type ligase-like ATP-grasp enzyme